MSNKGTFVIPFWSANPEQSKKYLDSCIKGITAQTDKNWQIVIIDDATSPEVADMLSLIIQERIHVIRNDNHAGPGRCRNLGIEWAAKKESPIILYNDADDISHPQRLEKVRKIFESHPKVGVVYSTFEVIDENGDPVHENLTPSIAEILDRHKSGSLPREENTWIDIATKTGYVNLTSTTSVRTEIAYANQFPRERVSEDYHTWLRYSAYGANFRYDGSIPSLYRIPQGTASSSRSREPNFYENKVRVDKMGFAEACSLRGGISIDQINYLMISFLIKEAETVVMEGCTTLAGELIEEALLIDKETTLQLLINLPRIRQELSDLSDLF